MTIVYLLVGDIGGTNSRLRLYTPGSQTALVEAEYKNEDVLIDSNAGAFEKYILATFLQKCWAPTGTLVCPIENAEIIACFGCAGPVSNNSVTMSNLGITIRGQDIEDGTYCDDIHVERIKHVFIINDFVAQGYGCLSLTRDELVELHPGSHELMARSTGTTGPKVCVGAGTGLGQCFLTRDGNDYVCYPSEGGHVEYNPRSDLEIELRSNLMENFSSPRRVSVERVASGTGLVNVYQFLVQRFPERVDPIVHEAFENANDDVKGKIVSVNAMEGSLCKQAIDIMIR
jgi:glucokinase